MMLFDVFRSAPFVFRKPKRLVFPQGRRFKDSPLPSLIVAVTSKKSHSRLGSLGLLENPPLAPRLPWLFDDHAIYNPHRPNDTFFELVPDVFPK
jgi:hypothetical protein